VISASDIAALVTTALVAGDVVLLYCRDSASLGEARQASRRASGWLRTLAAFPNLRLCRSATTGMGLVSAHLECAVGVDVEQTNCAQAFNDLVATLLHDNEFHDARGAPVGSDSLAHTWVRKEATLKAFGVGLAVPPNAIVTGGYSEQWRTVTHGILGTALVRSVPAPDGFVVGVALLGATPVAIRSFNYND
jgi:hypothetical protein